MSVSDEPSGFRSSSTAGTGPEVRCHLQRSVAPSIIIWPRGRAADVLNGLCCCAGHGFRKSYRQLCVRGSPGIWRGLRMSMCVSMCATAGDLGAAGLRDCRFTTNGYEPDVCWHLALVVLVLEVNLMISDLSRAAKKSVCVQNPMGLGAQYHALQGVSSPHTSRGSRQQCLLRMVRCLDRSTATLTIMPPCHRW